MDIPKLARRLRAAAKAGERTAGHLGQAANQIELLFHELGLAADVLLEGEE